MMPFRGRDTKAAPLPARTAGNREEERSVPGTKAATDGRYNVRVPGTTSRKMTVDGATLTLVLQRKRVKNVNARLRGSTLLVSAPMGMAEEKLEPAARELARKLLRRVHARQVNAEEDALSLACEVAQRFPEPPSVEAATFVTTQRARWASYSTRTKTMRLNAALRRMPRWVLKAVMAHELAHVFHSDHSPAFWELLRRACPETDRAEAFLAGVSWFARNADSLPLAERELLGGTEGAGGPP
jgi:predicted metal-dependent hydrolase